VPTVTNATNRNTPTLEEVEGDVSRRLDEGQSNSLISTDVELSR
jgi:hypothetical protein